MLYIKYLYYFHRQSRDLVKQVVQAHTQSHALFLQQKFSDSITDVRQGIATFKGSSPLSTPPLKEYCSAIYTAIKNGLDSSIINLQVNKRGVVLKWIDFGTEFLISSYGSALAQSCFLFGATQFCLWARWFS